MINTKQTQPQQIILEIADIMVKEIYSGSCPSEGSLGGNPNNSVAINKVLLYGVEEIPTDTTDFIDFEDGLFGECHSESFFFFFLLFLG